MFHYVSIVVFNLSVDLLCYLSIVNMYNRKYNFKLLILINNNYSYALQYSLKYLYLLSFFSMIFIAFLKTTFIRILYIFLGNVLEINEWCSNFLSTYTEHS